MTKRLPLLVATAAVAALALIPAQRAAAQPVTVTVNTPEFGFRIGAPFYPAPVIVAPAPVYAPPPVVYAPPPRVIYPPVVYAPAPRVVYTPRPVYVAPRWIPPGQRWRQHQGYYPAHRGDGDYGHRY
jgi:hypothetical protein